MTKAASRRAIQAVEALGFTGLEALIYVELLRSGPQSGYRVARLVGKAPANAYKTLDSLVARAAVLCDDAGTKVYRAVPYAQVAAALAAELEQRSKRASELLDQIEHKSVDDGIYRLVREAQAFEHARGLITGAGKILLVDAFPRALEELSDSIREAVARGVRVGIRKYRSSSPIKGAIEADVPSGEAILDGWSGEYIGISADAASMVVVLIAPDGSVTSGIATENRYVAWAYTSGLYHEIRFALLAALAKAHPEMPLGRAIDSTENVVPADLSLRPTT